MRCVERVEHVHTSMEQFDSDSKLNERCDVRGTDARESVFKEGIPFEMELIRDCPCRGLEVFTKL